MAAFTDILSSVYTELLDFLLFSLGLWMVFGKLKWKQRWMAWIPGLRIAALGRSVQLTREGVLCGIMEVVSFVVGYFSKGEITDRFSLFLSLAMLVLLVLLVVYRLRIYVRLLRVFGMKKRWILVWIFFDWLVLMIIGFGKKFQPVELPEPEDWEAGTAPAEISGTENVHFRPAAESGLSVDLFERTAKDFGKTHYLLKDISLDIPKGSLVLLLGGSGAGKTTLVNAIIGYEKAKARMTLNGADIYKDYAHMKYKIGFVPQKNLMRGNDTVLQTVDDAAELRLPSAVSTAERKSRVQEVMDLLGLSAGASGLVCKKSGGQLRRISIAMELVSDPELFVLDEPDSGLDGVIAREIFSKLRAIADEGRIVIVITHTPDRVIDLFDKVIVLARDSGRVGRLAFYGSPQEARDFFGKETMEDVVMSVNSKEQGGEGLAEHYIERYAALAAATEGGAAT